MATDHDMTRRTVFITGAARGIGAAVAERMHRRGANVALVGLEPDRLRARAEALGEERAAWFEADVTDSAQLDAAVAGTVDRFGGIDVAIANAGLSFVGALQTQPVEEWVRTVEVNLLGVYRTNRAVLDHVVASKGYVLNIASLSAIAHAPLMSAYTASKAGVEAMTDALRVELAPTGAVAGCAYFGFIDTDLVRGAYQHPATKALNGVQPGFIMRPIPLDRAVDAVDRGIRRRARRLWAPWFVGPMLAVRGLIQPVIEWGMARNRTELETALRLAEPANAGDGPGADARLGIAVGADPAVRPDGQAVDQGRRP